VSVHFCVCLPKCEDIRLTTLEFLWKQSPPMQLKPAVRPDHASSAASSSSSSRSLIGGGGGGGGGVFAEDGRVLGELSGGAKQLGRGGWEWPAMGGSLAFSSSASALRPGLARHAASTPAAAVAGAAASLPPLQPRGGGGSGGARAAVAKVTPQLSVPLAPAVVSEMDLPVMVSYLLASQPLLRCSRGALGTSRVPSALTPGGVAF